MITLQTPEGWEFAKVFSAKFHTKEKKTDLVRRRRWHRKMVQEDPTAAATFVIDMRSEVNDTWRKFEGMTEIAIICD